jgi:hypothetical protein
LIRSNGPRNKAIMYSGTEILGMTLMWVLASG